MSVLSEVKETIISAKKMYDKEKYILVLEEQVDILQKEIERLNTRIEKENDELLLNSDHLQIFEEFRKNNYSCYELQIREFVKNNIDLEIALSELLEYEFLDYPAVIVPGEDIKFCIPEDKKVKLLQALKKRI